MIQAVILAAGRGSRLGEEAHHRPKCLLEVGDRTLIEHQLSALTAMGIKKICVVVGYDAKDIRSMVGSRCTYIYNARYAQTNSLYSLWLARHWVKGSFVLLNGDVVASPAIYEDLLNHSGSALTYDSSSGDDEEQMKVAFSRGRLQAISKQLPVEESEGESLGLLQFDATTADLLFREADAMMESGAFGSWAPAAVNRIASKVSIRGVDVAGLPWAEIDFPDDLAYARQAVGLALRKGKCA